MAIQILAVIGIVILCIFLVLLSCCATVLLIPIHYEITGGKESDNIFCKLKGHFFFKKIKLIVSYTYGVDPVWRLKVFKKTYGSKKKKKKKQSASPKKPEPEQNLVIAREKQPELILDTNILELEPEPVFPTAIDLTQLKKEHALDGQEVKRVKLKDIPKATSPPTPMKTIFDINLKIPKWISDCVEKGKRWIEKATTLKQQAKHLWSQKDVWDALKKLIKRLIHHMKADELSVIAKIGFADPCNTGQFMGIVSILIGKYGDNVLITPDFEKENFEDIEVYAKGRIFIAHFMHSFLQFICHPSIRAKIKEYRKGRKQDG